MKKPKIAMIANLKASSHEDIATKKIRNDYYDSQLESLLNYLQKRFPKLTVDLLMSNIETSIQTKWHNGYKIIQFPFIKKPFFVSSLLFNFTTFVYLFRSRPSIVYMFSSGDAVFYLGSLLYSKLFRIPFYMGLRNPPISISYLKKLSSVDKAIVKISDKICMLFSDKIVHISNEAKNLLKNHPNLYGKSIVMGSCSNEIFATCRKKETSIAKQLSFVYWGIIDAKRELESTINGFAKARDLNKDFHAEFYLIGQGKDVERLQKYCKDMNLENIFFTDYMNQEDLCKFIQEKSAVAIIPIPPLEFFRYSSPLKLAEAVTMNCPIIASNIEPNHVVEKYNLGILCDHTADGFAQSFLHFSNISKLKMTEFKNNCEKAKYIFSSEHVCKEVGDSIANEKCFK